MVGCQQHAVGTGAGKTWGERVDVGGGKAQMGAVAVHVAAVVDACKEGEEIYKNLIKGTNVYLLSDVMSFFIPFVTPPSMIFPT